MLIPFTPPPGLNSDDSSFLASGAWVDGSNVRFWNGSAETVGGVAQIVNLATILSATYTDLFAFSRAGAPTFAYGATSGELLVGSINAPVNRSPVIGTVTGGYSFAAWGDVLLGAARGETLYQQSGTDIAVAVLNAPHRIDAGILVTPERQVIAFGCNEEVSGEFNPMCIRGSDIEDYTDWTTSAANNAFEYIIEGSGAIIAAMQVGPHIAVWTTSSLYIGQFIGDPAQTYRFDKVADVRGPVTVRSATTLNGSAWWMGRDNRLRVWVPGSLPQSIPCPIFRDFNEAAIDPASQIFSFITTNRSYEEVWYFYYDSRSPGSRTTRYVAYSIRESRDTGRPVWFRGILSRSAMLDSELVRAVSIGNNSGILGVDEESIALRHDDPASSLPAYIVSGDQYIDNGQHRFMIRGVIPDFSSQGAGVYLTVNVRDYPQGTATESGPHFLNVSPFETTKKDFRASGRIFSCRFERDSPGQWRIGKFLLDVVPLGER